MYKLYTFDLGAEVGGTGYVYYAWHYGKVFP